MKIRLKQLLLILLISAPLLIWLSSSEKKSFPLSQENRAPLQPSLSTSHWGMHVIEANTHETIASYQPSHSFVPASIVKIFTAAMALETLGPYYTFDTLLS